MSPVAPIAGSSRLGVSAVVLLFALTTALALAPVELGHYTDSLAGQHDPPTSVVFGTGLVAKTLAALTPVVALALLLAWLGSPRSAIFVGCSGSVLATLYINADLALQTVTGNNLFEYLWYLDEPEALQWAGEIALAAPISAWLASSAPALLSATIGAALAWRLVASGRRAPNRTAVLALSAIWLALLVAGPVALRWTGSASEAHRMADAQPWRWDIGFKQEIDAIEDASRRANLDYAPRFEEYRTARDRAPVATRSVRHKPNVIVIVLESFRHDALRPEVMPNLWRLAQRGARLTQHRAGSMTSHLGFFSLMYAQPSALYFDVLDARIEPALTSRLRSLGYQSHFISGALTDWQRMEEFLGKPHFEAETTFSGGWPRDRDVKVVAALEQAATRPGPQLVVAFMMSTHFGYDYPPDTGTFLPDMAWPSALSPGLRDQRQELLNRYWNSAQYADRLLGGLFDRLDPADNLILVTGDHGESVFDDGTLAHSSRLSAIQTRVPLVIAGPGVAAGTVIDRATDHTDLLTTILDRLGARPSHGIDLLGSPPRLSYSVSAAVSDQFRTQPAVLLATADHQYTVRLRTDEPVLEILGRLDHTGLPDRSTFSPADANRLVTRFGDYLRRWGRPPPATSSSAFDVARKDQGPLSYSSK